MRDRPLSLLASGEFEGNVKVYLKKGNRLQLVFEGNGSGSFVDVCKESCDVDVDSNIIELFVNVNDNSSFFLKELAYKVEARKNTAPSWKGGSVFKARVGKPTIIDLADYFSDEDGDSLIFLSTGDDGLDVVVRDSLVTLTPRVSGTKSVVFISSDLLAVTRIPVSIEIQD